MATYQDPRVQPCSVRPDRELAKFRAWFFLGLLCLIGHVAIAAAIVNWLGGAK